jgi:hypothetical protein
LNHKFAAFYATVISVALVGSLSASRLNPAWNRVVFTFPPEAQMVVENGTAVMDVSWRWLPETLEMMVKVNDDDDDFDNKTCCDTLGLLFDSDNDGNFTKGLHQIALDPTLDDHGIFAGIFEGANVSTVFARCYIRDGWDYYGEVFVRHYLSGVYTEDFITYLNSSYCTYREDEGYVFKLSIPIELINVKPPTPIYASFTDQSFVYQTPRPLDSSHYVIFANFTG